MILLNYVVEIANRSTTAAPAEFSSTLELRDRFRIRRIPFCGLSTVLGSWAAQPDAASFQVARRSERGLKPIRKPNNE